MNETVNMSVFVPPFEAVSYLPSFSDIILVGLVGGTILYLGAWILPKIGEFIGEYVSYFDVKTFYMAVIVVILWNIYLKM